MVGTGDSRLDEDIDLLEKEEDWNCDDPCEVGVTGSDDGEALVFELECRNSEDASDTDGDGCGVLESNEKESG